MSDESKNDNGVGYGRPPENGRFKKGRSGNLKGRPKKPDPAIVDLDAILPGEVKVNGALVDSRKVELLQQVKKALDPKGPLKSVRHVFDEFEKYGAMKPPEFKQQRIELPSLTEVPWAVQTILIRQGFPPPWSKKQLDMAKAAYMATRNEGDRLHDVKAGYEQWLTS